MVSLNILIVPHKNEGIGEAVPGFTPLQTQVPHSAQTNRVTVRPLSAVRWKDRVSPPVKRHAAAATMSAEEKALLVSF